MRRTLFAIVTFAAIAAFAACGGSGKPAETPRPVVENVPPADAAPPPAPDAAPAVASAVASATGIPECDLYLAEVERLAQCEAMPAEARDAMKQAAESLRSAFQQEAEIPPEARKAAGEACLQAVEAIRQAGSSMGCAAPPAAK
jgi:hypothetical protein